MVAQFRLVFELSNAHRTDVQNLRHRLHFFLPSLQIQFSLSSLALFCCQLLYGSILSCLSHLCLFSFFELLHCYQWFFLFHLDLSFSLFLGIVFREFTDFPSSLVRTETTIVTNSVWIEIGCTSVSLVPTVFGIEHIHMFSSNLKPGFVSDSKGMCSFFGCVEFNKSKILIVSC